MVNRLPQGDANPADSGDLFVGSLIKPDGEIYYFICDEEHAPEMLFRFGQYAADPELSMTFNDAQGLTKSLHETLFKEEPE